ncbi:hypothetical protein RO3G_02051 [Lichtheimia corymbifera JMRC:FSU:9682]|uniref:Uncharacterized protein n=1 Tax=Lichtheimia corymbifera JMRC:FSU:9682 TaxID=1263082 RepID=A0A068SFQ9_9FUNG|nr:hypothetical protein RO3G_02051 [Lichtheimia corymbifera JMRC:FSU:9682]
MSPPLTATTTLQYPSPISTTTHAPSDSNNVDDSRLPQQSSNDNHHMQQQQRQRGRSRGLSLTITGANTGTSSSNSNNSTSSLPCPPKIAQPSTVSIQFDCTQQLVLRPGRIVRGTVILHATRPIHATQIRIKLRAEEMVAIRVKDKPHCCLHKVTVVHFEVDTKVWGHETSAFVLNTWQTLEPGTHKFPFALKFCNVNFPPSVNEPAGCSIQYLWTAHVDGAAFQPSIRSKQYSTPFRPIICAPMPVPCALEDWLYKSDMRTPYAYAKVLLSKQVFCPDDWVDIQLEIRCLPSDMIISDLGYTLKKHHDAKLRLQQGTAYRKDESVIVYETHTGVPGNDGEARIPLHFRLPTRGVSPSFTSRHLRVYYSLVLHIECRQQQGSTGRLLKKNNIHKADLVVPIAIANLQHDQMLQVSNLTAIQPYQTSDDVPMFFDPSLDEPPSTPLLTANGTGASSLLQQNSTPPLQSPPNYFSLHTLPPQLRKQKRVERTTHTSHFLTDSTDTVDVVDVLDDEW